MWPLTVPYVNATKNTTTQYFTLYTCNLSGEIGGERSFVGLNIHDCVVGVEEEG